MVLVKDYKKIIYSIFLILCGTPFMIISFIYKGLIKMKKPCARFVHVFINKA